MIKNILAIYNQLYGRSPAVYSSSPGRINLIGEHTDYNNGFVLPAAIDKRIYAAFGKRTDNEIHLFSVDFNDSITINIEKTEPLAEHTWANYVLGIVAQLNKTDYKTVGFNVVLGGDIPIGAGLSSSAAMECSVIYGLNELFQLNIDKLEMVKMAQKAEHEYAGVRCGIMDQFASVYGKKNLVIRLDCRSLDYAYLPLAMDGFKILLFDSNVKHSLASSEYNIRRAQCEAGTEMIQKYHPEVKSLRDINIDQLEKYVYPVDKLIYRRCKYVVEENIRLLAACDDLENNDMISFGKKMYQTHQGLSRLYEVSCNELDFLVDIVKDNTDVPGARMMGGGFGGCTINIVKDSAANKVISLVSESYENKFGQKPGIHIVNIDNGSTLLDTLN